MSAEHELTGALREATKSFTVRELRKAKIAGEETGPFYIGRRYHVNRTWFWGYLRQPRESWSKAKLVVIVKNGVVDGLSLILISDIH